MKQELKQVMQFNTLMYCGCIIEKVGNDWVALGRTHESVEGAMETIKEAVESLRKSIKKGVSHV